MKNVYHFISTISLTSFSIFVLFHNNFFYKITEKFLYIFFFHYYKYKLKNDKQKCQYNIGDIFQIKKHYLILDIDLKDKFYLTKELEGENGMIIKIPFKYHFHDNRLLYRCNNVVDNTYNQSAIVINTYFLNLENGFSFEGNKYCYFYISTTIISTIIWFIIVFSCYYLQYKIILQ